MMRCAGTLRGLWRLAVLVAFALAVACGDDDGPDNSGQDDAGRDSGSPAAEPVRFEVPAGGGEVTLRLPSGNQLAFEFPASAAGEDITLTPATGTELGWDDGELQDVVRMEPDGLEFEDPVIVKPMSGDVVLLTFRPGSEKSAPEVLELSADGEGLELRHFSFLGLIGDLFCGGMSAWSTRPNAPQCAGFGADSTYVEFSCSRTPFCWRIEASCCAAPGSTECNLGDANLRLSAAYAGTMGGMYPYCARRGETDAGVMDAGRDGSVEPRPDSGMDAGGDSGMDAGRDSGTDPDDDAGSDPQGGSGGSGGTGGTGGSGSGGTGGTGGTGGSGTGGTGGSGGVGGGSCDLQSSGTDTGCNLSHESNCYVRVLDGAGREVQTGYDTDCNGQLDSQCRIKTYNAAGQMLIDGFDSDCDGDRDSSCNTAVFDQNGRQTQAFHDSECDGDGEQDCSTTTYDDPTMTATTTRDSDCNGTPDLACIRYTYDAAYRMLDQWFHAMPNCMGVRNNCYSSTYDANGNQLTYTADTDCNSVPNYCASYTYDAQNHRLTETLNQNCDATQDSCSTSTYDAQGNTLTKSTDTGCNGSVESCQSWTYTYDGGNRITQQATRSVCGTPTADRCDNYTYDASGNLLTQNGDVGCDNQFSLEGEDCYTHTYNGANQRTSSLRQINCVSTGYCAYTSYGYAVACPAQ